MGDGDPSAGPGRVWPCLWAAAGDRKSLGEEVGCSGPAGDVDHFLSKHAGARLCAPRSLQGLRAELAALFPRYPELSPREVVGRPGSTGVSWPRGLSKGSCGGWDVELLG